MTDFHFNFYQARVHRAKHEFDLAEKFCVEALKFDPRHVGALTLLGDIKAIQGYHDEARNAFAAAVEIEPKNTSVLVNLASAVKGIGDFDGARALLEKAITIDSKLAPAFYTLAGIVKFKPGDPLIDDFVRLKKRVYGNALYRCVACFALGKVYNDIGEWDLAFENYAEGNQRRRTSDEYNKAPVFYNAIERFFTPDLLAKGENEGHPSQSPVFVVGMPRSGSTLIEEILSRSSDIKGLAEPDDINDLFMASYKQIPSAEYKIKLEPTPGGVDFSGIGEIYVNTMRKIAPGAERLIDKNLLNHAMVGFIRQIFPNAAIIHAKRDPIDTCLSCYFQNFTEGHDYSFDLNNLGKQYAAYAKIMKHWESIYGAEIFNASYERMIADKDAAIADLFAHIDMPMPDADALDKPAKRGIPTASAWQARQPIYKTSVKRWKNYEKHLGPLFNALEDAGFDYQET